MTYDNLQQVNINGNDYTYFKGTKEQLIQLLCNSAISQVPPQLPTEVPGQVPTEVPGQVPTEVPGQVPTPATFQQGGKQKKRLYTKRTNTKKSKNKKSKKKYKKSKKHTNR